MKGYVLGCRLEEVGDQPLAHPDRVLGEAALDACTAVLGLVDEDFSGLDGLVVQHRLPFERRLRTLFFELAIGPQLVCRRSLPDFDRRGSWYSLNGLPGKDPLEPAVRPGGVYRGMKE
jgi:hypothetical protein